MELEIIYQDEYLIAINKPYGYFVHKSSLDATSSMILMKLLRDQINQYVYPIHRIDRKTSGVLLFALDRDTLAASSKLFENRNTKKTYHAICRGYTDDHGSIDYALFHEDLKKSQDALTHYTTLQRREIDLAAGKFTTSRYSLVSFQPITGRMHQIRRHASHIFHPIIGDRPHGCNKQNKLFLENFGLVEMMLHSKQLEFTHPVSNEAIVLKARYSSEFTRIAGILGFDLSED